MELAYEHTNNAEKVDIEPERVGAHGITEVLYHVSSHEKLPLLLGLLAAEGGSRILIFVNRRTTAADLVRTLTANGYPARALAGNVPQDRRLKILRTSRRGASPSSSRRTSLRAVCTSTGCRTSSTTTCPRTRRITCTASGGRGARAPSGRLCRSPATTTSSPSTRSRS